MRIAEVAEGIRVRVHGGVVRFRKCRVAHPSARPPHAASAGPPRGVTGSCDGDDTWLARMRVKKRTLGGARAPQMLPRARKRCCGEEGRTRRLVSAVGLRSLALNTRSDRWTLMGL